MLNPEADAQRTGYHTIQSINAIANGGIFGRGLGAGAQAQTARLPEHHTDFIFAVLAEEWGLMGSLLALMLLFILVLLIIDGARHTPDRFLELSGYGIATLIVFQIVVNVGMVTGIMPVVGMTLPFFSKGGSSLVSLCFAVGLMIRALDARLGRGGTQLFMSSYDADLLAHFAEEWLSQARWQRFNEVLDQRTRYLTVVMDNLYQLQNASAVMRSCEAMGVQDVHLITRNPDLKHERGIAMGSAYWLSVHRHEGDASNRRAIEQLKRKDIAWWRRAPTLTA